ncbi:MAG TPA: beta-propeller fold lactonase family protein [Solirubrobacterales bacterium]|nr:beta-propeller fold lactonase family protein [Solirubrobacterales bacterium]
MLSAPQLGERRCTRLRAASVALLAIGALATYPKPASASDLFVASPGTNKLLPFSIAGDGAVTPIACTGSSCNTGSAPWGVAVSPSGRFVYVSNVDGGSNSSVTGFVVGSEGTLSPLPCSPSTNCETQKEPRGIAISPSGSFLYVANHASNTVSIFAIAGDGTLTQVPCSPTANCNTESGPQSIAVTPDGHFLYVVNGGTLSSYAIAANGTLTPLPCSALCSSGASLGQAAITPSGAFLYVLAEGGGRVVPLAIASDGSLSPIPCSPASNCEGGSGESSLAISPNGQDLYVTNTGSPSTAVVVFSIGPGGVLAKQTCSPASSCDAGKEPVGLTLSPSGGSLYAVDYGTSKLLPFSVQADGLLAPLACTPSSNCEAGSQSDYTQSIAAQPDQGPLAGLSATAAPAGSPTLLDASGSSAAPGESVARWDWNFGDGTVLENGGPKPQHTYASPGVYTVTVTVSDQDGCSSSLIFTGQTAYCNGSTAAQATRTVTVPPASPLDPSVSNLSETARIWRESNKLAQISARKKKKPPVGTTFSFTLNEPASVTFTFTERASGRKIGKRCLAQTKKNRKKHRCTHTDIAGELTFSAHAGTNRVRFGGRISKRKKLKPGSYTLLVAATASGMNSTPRTLRFKVAKG